MQLLSERLRSLEADLLPLWLLSRRGQLCKVFLEEVKDPLCRFSGGGARMRVLGSLE